MRKLLISLIVSLVLHLSVFAYSVPLVATSTNSVSVFPQWGGTTMYPSIIAPYFTATSTTATSSFAGKLTFGSLFYPDGSVMVPTQAYSLATYGFNSALVYPGNNLPSNANILADTNGDMYVWGELFDGNGFGGHKGDVYQSDGGHHAYWVATSTLGLNAWATTSTNYLINSSSTIPTGTPTNGNVFLGNGSRWTSVATSSLGISGGASLSGGSTNTLTYWTSGTAVGATSSPTVGYITATSTTATSTLAGFLAVNGTNSTSTFAGALNAGGTNGLNVITNGTVAIGTTTTSVALYNAPSKLTVDSSATAVAIPLSLVADNAGYPSIWINNTNPTGQNMISFGAQGTEVAHMRSDFLGNIIYAGKGNTYFCFQVDFGIQGSCQFGNTVNAPFMYIGTNGAVGIGTNQNPLTHFDVTNGTQIFAADPLGVVANLTGPTQTGQGSTISIQSNDAVAADIGGIIGFGGNYNGSQYANWASIKGLKADSTSGNYGGYLGFWTRLTGGSSIERMRIATGGFVGIATTTPATALDVNGDITDEKGAAYVGQIVCYLTGGKLGHISIASLLASGPCVAN